MELNTMSTPKVDFKLLKDYYEAVKDADFWDLTALKTFMMDHPTEYSYFSKVHHKRSVVRSNLEALQATGFELYFGTLTFNESKDRNKQETKRKEAFKVLNKLFEFFLVVEELGEERRRYHIHFVGSFRSGVGFDDFVSSWHSRQNIEKVKDNKKVCQYLVKYVSKELPRIRRNRALVFLEREYRKGKRLERVGFKSIGIRKHIDDAVCLTALLEL